MPTMTLNFDTKHNNALEELSAKHGMSKTDLLADMERAIFATPAAHLTSRDILIHNLRKARGSHE
jgi:hypothetical protein